MKWFWIIVVIIILGIVVGISLFNYGGTQENNENVKIENVVNTIDSVEISSQEERTTPNTLMIYKTYYIDCKHYIQEYKDIDATLVNLTEKELKEKMRGKWNVDKFSSNEIELSREEEEYCDQHYKIKLENNAIVIYSIDRNGIETEYEQTEITTEYLTENDILQLSSGIEIYGRENLTKTMEDYE